jgi:peptide/nickel transport system permease protein
MADGKKQSYWRLVGRQFLRKRLAMAGLVVVLLLFGIAIFAPFLANDIPIMMKHQGRVYWLPNVIEYRELVSIDFKTWQPGPGEFALRAPVPYSATSQDLRNRLKKPGDGHWLGTDDRGRDVLSRMIWGARVSMTIGFVAVGIAVLIGVVVGAIGGFYGGVADAIVMRLVEIMMCIPTFFLILSLIAFMPRQSIYNIMIVIGVTGWTGVARLVRGEFLKLKAGDFVTAARATGLSDARIMFRHILPNALSPVLVSATFGVAGAILTESGLSFLGFGVPPPNPSWGEILKQSQNYVDFAWWLVMFPGLAVFITTTGFNLVGEGLRDAMDPRLRR